MLNDGIMIGARRLSIRDVQTSWAIRYCGQHASILVATGRRSVLGIKTLRVMDGHRVTANPPKRAITSISSLQVGIADGVAAMELMGPICFLGHSSHGSYSAGSSDWTAFKIQESQFR